jgi:hypothetical protein
MSVRYRLVDESMGAETIITAAMPFRKESYLQSSIGLLS